MNLEILYGINPVQEALAAHRRRIQTVYVASGRYSSRIQNIIDLAGQKAVEVRHVNAAMLTSLSGTANHQNIAAEVSPYFFYSLDEMLSPSKDSGNPPFILLPDSLTDPQNLGALIRTAFCAGVDGIVLAKDRSVSPTPAVSRVSAGAMEHMRMVRVVNLVNTIRILKKSGIWVAGLDKDANQTIYDIDWTVPVAIVVGGEGRGIRDLVRSNCDLMASIPQAASFNSLNASVAGALVMYEVFRQRQRRNHE
ncbi:MAG: 23S rRNA (guanosine(2251)-2'-O)-methyltransferase RlmB [Desulfatirhabdiaceae bacterium]